MAPILRLQDIKLEILPCYVFDMLLRNEEELKDFDLTVGIKKELNFE